MTDRTRADRTPKPLPLSSIRDATRCELLRVDKRSGLRASTIKHETAEQAAAADPAARCASGRQSRMALSRQNTQADQHDE